MQYLNNLQKHHISIGYVNCVAHDITWISLGLMGKWCKWEEILLLFYERKNKPHGRSGPHHYGVSEPYHFMIAAPCHSIGYANWTLVTSWTVIYIIINNCLHWTPFPIIIPTKNRNADSFYWPNTEDIEMIAQNNVVIILLTPTRTQMRSLSIINFLLTVTATNYIRTNSKEFSYIMSNLSCSKNWSQVVPTKFNLVKSFSLNIIKFWYLLNTISNDLNFYLVHTIFRNNSTYIIKKKLKFLRVSL